MDAWSSIAMCVFYTAAVWSSHAKVPNAQGLLYGAVALVAAYVALRLHYRSREFHWLTLASMVLLCAAIVWWLAASTSPWYNGLTGGPDVLLYISLATWFLDNVRQFKIAAHAYAHLWDKVHAMRTCIFRCVLVFPIASAIYYVRAIIDLLKAPGAPGIVSSTLESNFNRTKCAALDAADDMKYELYDVTPFTVDCVGEVWERLRINILVIVQLHVSFILIVDMPYWLQRGLDAKCGGKASAKRKEISAALYCVQCTTLFFGATAALNQIERWMILDIIPAVLLTLASVVSAALAVIRGTGRANRVIPFLQECTDADKDESLKL